MRILMALAVWFWAHLSMAAPNDVAPYTPPEKGTVAVLNIPQAKLFLFVDNEYMGSWPVGPGSIKSPTPTGQWRISEIRQNPTWNVPVSIQKEMKSMGMPVQKQVPPGPDNPLGPVFIRLGKTAIGIHGTNRPTTVSDWQSFGCVRMLSTEVVELAEWLKPGDLVKVVYEPLLITEDEGELFLTVFPDIYEKGEKAYSMAAVRAQLSRQKIKVEHLDELYIQSVLELNSDSPQRIGAVSD